MDKPAESRHFEKNISRLSYGTWASQDFLSSTHVSKSLLTDPVESRKKKSGAAPKKKKKVQQKVIDAIQFSSEDEDFQPLSLKPPLSSKKTPKAKTKEKLPASSTRTRNPLTPRQYENVSRPGKGQRYSPADANLPSCSKPSTITKSQPKKKRVQAVLSGCGPLDTSEEPNSSSSSYTQHSSSLSSSLSSVPSRTAPTKVTAVKKGTQSTKKNVPKKKATFVQAVQFSSDSDMSDFELNGDTMADLRKKLQESCLSKNSINISVSSSSRKDSLAPTSERHPKHGNKKQQGVSVLKKFVMDSDSEDKDSDVTDKCELIVPESQDIVGPTSEESIDEAFVTIPCSQDEAVTHGDKVDSVKANKSRKSFSNGKKYGLIGETDTEGSEVVPKYDVIVPDTESPENFESSQNELMVTVPCSQNEVSETTPDEQVVTVVRVASLSPPRNSLIKSPNTETSSSCPANTLGKTFVPCSETEDVDIDSLSEYGEQVIPDSQAKQVPNPDTCVSSSNMVAPGSTGPTVKESVIVVPDTYTCNTEDESDVPTDVIPDSQVGEHDELQASAGVASPVPYQDTPSLVSRLVSLVWSGRKTPAQSPAKVASSPGVVSNLMRRITSPAVKATPNEKQEFAERRIKASSSKKDPKSVNVSSSLPETTHKKFFEILQYSSEEDISENGEDAPGKTKTFLDLSVSHHSSVLSQNNTSNSDLSHRLQCILTKSTKKQKKTPRMKKTKSKGQSKKYAVPSTSSEDSMINIFSNKRKNINVTVPDSQSDDVSVIEDSQGQTHNNDRVDGLSVPDSQQTNSDYNLQLSLSRSGGSYLEPVDESAVDQEITNTGGYKQSNRLATPLMTGSSYSPEIPCNHEHGAYIRKSADMNELYEDRNIYRDQGPSPQGDGYSDEGSRHVANVSLQVSLDGSSVSMTRCPSEQSSELSDVSRREISLQVSLSEHDTADKASFLSFKGGQQVSYEESNEQATEISLETENLNNDMCKSDDSCHLSDCINPEGGNDEGDSYNSEDEEGGVQQRNMSLQVSMCVNPVMEDSDDGDADDFEQGLSHRLQSSLYVSVHEKAGDNRENNEVSLRSHSPRQHVSRNGNVNVSHAGSDIEILSDDSDADPDFEVSLPKTKRKPKEYENGKKCRPTKHTPKRQKRSKSSSKSSDAEADKNLTEAQSVKTVLLCEKKESVAGLGPDTEDDYSLPDLSPPKMLPINTENNRAEESSEDDQALEAFYERMRTPLGRRKQAFSDDDDDDFVVEDSISDEDGDSHFYSRINQRFVETGAKRPSSGDDAVFKTPQRPPHITPRSISVNRIAAAEGGCPPRANSTRTPAPPKRIRDITSGNNLRSHSTGHLPQFEGFLKSLSPDIPARQRHPEAARYVTDFKKKKEELTQKLFKMYNETIFDGKLPEDMLIKWNSRLLTTAGFCAYKRDKSVACGRVCRVELSVKVCDSAERVRDTLVHELCHAAVWLVYGKNDGHGRYWQAFSQKAMRVHPDLPSISRCHMYDINHKYIYKCNKCGQQIGRHTKSLNTEKKVCGICHGKFEAHINTPKGLTPQAQRTPRTPNPFALFVKENYNVIKQRNTNFKHADVMKALSAEFAAKAKVNN